jgi:hypothetical protein
MIPGFDRLHSLFAIAREQFKGGVGQIAVQSDAKVAMPLKTTAVSRIKVVSSCQVKVS